MAEAQKEIIWKYLELTNVRPIFIKFVTDVGTFALS